jgi:hypothetical protein
MGTEQIPFSLFPGVLATLEEHYQAERHWSILTGCRRSGKSTLMRAFARVLSDRNCLVSLVDCGTSPGGSETPWQRLVAHLAAQIAQEKGRFPRRKRSLTTATPSGNRWVAIVDLLELLGSLDRRPVVLIDGLDALRNRSGLSEVAELLRYGLSMCRMKHIAIPHVVLACVVNQQEYLSLGYSSPFDVGREVQLTTPETSRVESLVRSTIPASPDTQDALIALIPRLVEASGGLPGLLTQLLDCLASEAPSRPPNHLWNATLARVSTTVALEAVADLAPVVDAAYADGATRRVLVEILRRGEYRATISRGAERGTAYGVLRRESNGFRISGSVISARLKLLAGEDETAILGPPDHLQAELLNDRITAIEARLPTALDPGGWAVHVAASIGDCRRERDHLWELTIPTDAESCTIQVHVKECDLPRDMRISPSLRIDVIGLKCEVRPHTQVLVVEKTEDREELQGGSIYVRPQDGVISSRVVGELLVDGVVARAFSIIIIRLETQ